MADLRNYSHEFLREFIDLYRDNPCLWKIKSKDYSNRNKKTAAYEVLREKLKENDKTASKDSVIKKINSLRSCFRKELKKVKASEKSGAGEEDLYKPSLWYFDYLLFLTDQETPRRSTSNIEDSDDTEDVDISREGNENVNVEDENTMSDIPTSETPISTRSASSSSSRKTTVKSRKSYQDKSDEILGIVADNLKASGKYTSFGQHIAEELRSLTAEQAVFCQKVINDAIFEAKLGNLNRNSSILCKTDVPKEQTPLKPSTVYTVLPSAAQYVNNTNVNYVPDCSSSQQLNYSSFQDTNASHFFHTFTGERPVELTNELTNDERNING